MGSLRLRIGLLWVVLAVVCAAMLLILVGAEREGPAARVARAEAQTRASCATIRGAVDRLVPASDDGTSTLMDVVVDLSLRDAYGIEGGVWDGTHGFTAYAYPTYEGRVRKTDVPRAEMDSIESLGQRIDAEHSALGSVRQGGREAVVLAACALPRRQVAWTLTRVDAAQAATMQRITAAAAIALGLVALAGAWLLVGLRRWSRKLGALEVELASRENEATRIEAKGEPDLDRLVLAFNASAGRIDALDAESERLARELAQADRLGSLGRVAAGLAHEIRNPLGSMRLRAENALAVQGSAAFERRGAALTAVLATVDRVDGLVTSLLTLTRPVRPMREATDLALWLAQAIDFRAEQAVAQNLTLDGVCAPGLQADIDAVALARALDNLLLNALQHTPSGGSIGVLDRRRGGRIGGCASTTAGPASTPACRRGCSSRSPAGARRARASGWRRLSRSSRATAARSAAAPHRPAARGSRWRCHGARPDRRRRRRLPYRPGRDAGRCRPCRHRGRRRSTRRCARSSASGSTPRSSTCACRA